MQNDSTATLLPEQTAERLRESAFTHLQRALRGSYRTRDFASAARLVATVAEIADELDHHPEVHLGWGRVAFELTSHDAGGVTDRDLGLAARIDAAAADAGATPVEAVLSLYELAIDAGDADAIRPFWRAVLDYEEVPSSDGGVELADPRRLGPRVWFQGMDVARTERNRLHMDVYVPAEHAEERLAATLEAGGTLVTDEFAPDWWVVADAEGNEACICTSSR
ncbi:MAG: 4a-hydroxytetrahydrobiopterin dehydratase [Salinibacterium sp.]|nr:VOC family protein [Salinibacterium sp.]MBF0672880.1 4a-hydroxytetrahydrobiopterin dehydratase [Salinibacterium sp.]